MTEHCPDWAIKVCPVKGTRFADFFTEWEYKKLDYGDYWSIRAQIYASWLELDQIDYEMLPSVVHEGYILPMTQRLYNHLLKTNQIIRIRFFGDEVK